MNAYHEILATQDCVEMWFIKVILLGGPRLGKTTVRRRLTGEIADISSSGEAEQPSTGIVESGHSVVIRNLSSTMAIVTPSEWSVATDLTDEVRMFLEFIYGHILDKKAAHKQEKKATMPNNDTTSIGSQGNTEIRPVVMSPTSTSASTDSTSQLLDHRAGSQPQGLMEVIDLFREAIGPKYWKDIKNLFEDTAFLKMEDTGGQPEFMDMLPALTIGPALYLLFCKLIDDLQSPYTCVLPKSIR